ncbi:hypothetical protein, partial [Dialister invisus]|uniref:hypothetical protein n=1 Tax=Dialister invisus TaxID=218538 RepID=UPI003AB84D97
VDFFRNGCKNPMTGCQASCFPYYNKISAAGEMLYFSLLHLYGTNDDWGKALLTMGNGKRHNDGIR